MKAAFDKIAEGLREAIAKTKEPSCLDVCPKCGGPTRHYCSWVCIDICPVCDRMK